MKNNRENQNWNTNANIELISIADKYQENIYGETKGAFLSDLLCR